MLRTGGCRCGRLRYELRGELGFTFNCHCGFCRQVHGAAFTTVALVKRDQFAWSANSAQPARWVTPLGSTRHFCGVCAAPICNHPREPELSCLVVSSLDDASSARPWAHVNVESKLPWLVLADDLPQFAAWASPSELAELARKHRPR